MTPRSDPALARQAAGFWRQLAQGGRELLEAGRSTVDLYHLACQHCAAFYPADQAEALEHARLATEAIASVHARAARQPPGEPEFFQQVMADVLLVRRGPHAGVTAALYPAALPAQFFADPQRMLDRAGQLGSQCLEALWQETPGCQGPLPAGVSHTGMLKDGRRYLVLRLPPPQVRFEAHFVACVGAGGDAPPRMFAIERGVAPEESVLCERYADGGRLRLGAAGPAESSNFIRLVRQQLGL